MRPGTPGPVRANRTPPLGHFCGESPLSWPHPYLPTSLFSAHALSRNNLLIDLSLLFAPPLLFITASLPSHLPSHRPSEEDGGEEVPPPAGGKCWLAVWRCQPPGLGMAFPGRLGQLFADQVSVTSHVASWSLPPSPSRHLETARVLLRGSQNGLSAVSAQVPGRCQLAGKRSSCGRLPPTPVASLPACWGRAP